jgi:hypothetical protein
LVSRLVLDSKRLHNLFFSEPHGFSVIRTASPSKGHRPAGCFGPTVSPNLLKR